MDGPAKISVTPATRMTRRPRGGDPMSVLAKATSGLVLIASLTHATHVAAGWSPPWSPPCSSRPGDRVKLVGDEGKRRNLYHFSKGRWVNVTRFENRQSIFDYGVSPDGRYLFAWHMDVSPRRVSIYDLDHEGKRIGRFAPGFGGFVCWNAQNHLVHIFGCGSGCNICKVYDRQGRVLFELGERRMEISPSGRYLAALPNTGAPEVAIYDLHEANDRSGLISTTPMWNVGWIAILDDIEWQEERSVTFDYALWNDVAATRRGPVTLDLQPRGGGR
jgi:hypothetical protein